MRFRLDIDLRTIVSSVEISSPASSIGTSVTVSSSSTSAGHPDALSVCLPLVAERDRKLHCAPALSRCDRVIGACGQTQRGFWARNYGGAGFQYYCATCLIGVYIRDILETY